MSALLSPDTPAFAVPDANLVPVSDHLGKMMAIPASRMFLINKSLKVFQEKQECTPCFKRECPAGLYKCLRAVRSEDVIDYIEKITF